MKKQIKTEIYDNFKCTAQLCSFTCCKGWEISVDQDIYQKWISENGNPELEKNTKARKQGKSTEYAIKLRRGKECPFLDEIGLCHIVKSYGEDYLPVTCRTFPRLKNEFEGYHEYSLSCACPAVVDLMNGLEGKLRFTDDTESSDTPSSIRRVRELMLDLIRREDCSLRNRLLLIFHMLLSLYEDHTLIEEVINRYQDVAYCNSLMNLWNGLDIEVTYSCREMNELFLDITQNYRKEKNYQSYLQDIYELADKSDLDQYFEEMKEFNKFFNRYGLLLENCLAAKMFSNCCVKSIDEMLMSFQLVITEYILVRYSMFLKWLKSSEDGHETGYTELKEYITVYSRIIGYNAEGIREFWDESFDEAIWEFGYLVLLMNEQ